MTAYLVLQLYGPLASWGDVAVGEFRPSGTAPTKSAVLGLIGAALGIDRSDAEALAALHDGFGFATRVDATGVLLTDYHTAETAHANAFGRYDGPATRREELAAPDDKRKTILSTREYRCDALARAAIWNVAPAPWSLDHIAEALRRPVFVPYLGRKSCPPALPFSPRIVEAEHPVDALSGDWPEPALIAPVPKDRTRAYRWEGAASDPRAQQTVHRRDQARSRARWQFADRTEHVRFEEAPHVSQPD